MFESNFDTDWFSVDLVADTSYLLSSAGYTVVDAQGHLLTDTAFGDPTFTPTVSGTYYVVAASTGVGAYSLSITSFFDDFPESPNTAGLMRQTFVGTGSDDTFNAGDYPVNASGNDGNDLLIGSALSDILSGGNGNDTLVGLAGNDSINGGAGVELDGWRRGRRRLRRR